MYKFSKLLNPSVPRSKTFFSCGLLFPYIFNGALSRRFHLNLIKATQIFNIEHENYS